MTRRTKVFVALNAGIMDNKRIQAYCQKAFGQVIPFGTISSAKTAWKREKREAESPKPVTSKPDVQEVGEKPPGLICPQPGDQFEIELPDGSRVYCEMRDNCLALTHTIDHDPPLRHGLRLTTRSSYTAFFHYGKN
jgi:hypothetical protein